MEAAPRVARPGGQRRGGDQRRHVEPSIRTGLTAEDDLDEPEDEVESDGLEEADDDAGDVLEEVEDPEPAPPPAARRIARKPEHRQAPAPKEKATGELPWWATRGREGFTATAESKVEAMTAEAKRRGIKVAGSVNTF